MELIEELARAAIHRDSLRLRGLVQALKRANVDWSALPRPQTNDARVLGVAASLAELLAMREKQSPPTWTRDIGPLEEPLYLLQSADTMKRLRILCQTQAPEPMRKRRIYAPPNFLEAA